VTRTERFWNSHWTAIAACAFFLDMLYFHIAVTRYNWRRDDQTRMYALRHHLADALRWRP